MSFLDDIGDGLKSAVSKVGDAVSPVTDFAYNNVLSPVEFLAVKGVDVTGQAVSHMFGDVDLYDSALEGAKLLAPLNPALAAGAIVAEAIEPEGNGDVFNQVTSFALFGMPEEAIIFVGGRAENALQDQLTATPGRHPTEGGASKNLSPESLLSSPESLIAIEEQIRKPLNLSNVLRSTRFLDI